MPHANIDRLRGVKTLPQLIAYLRSELDWPIEAGDAEDIIFDYDPAELGFDAETTVHIKEVKQLRPLHTQQPWGVFWVNFEKKRLPVVMLRRALGHLVVKKRAAANKASQRAWQMDDLLFISAYGEDHDRAITFAHFSQDQGAPGELPVLKVLGWDDADTVLHLADAHRSLTEKLRWPEKPADISGWRQQWASAFTLRHREVITTTEKLVEELARLATNIREAVLFSVSRETDKGPWRRLLSAFQATLIHDLNEGSFADVIAQTISYGLLTARFSAPGTITLQNLVDMVPRTNPFLKELLGHFVSSAGRRRLFDVDEVGIDEVVTLLNRANADAIKNDFGNKTRGEDPVIHFYEHFLSAYNKQLKIQRGVFYTPQPVVAYIVRSVHELLQTEFGLADGLADTTTWGEMVKTHSGLKLPPLTDEPAENRTISPDDPFVVILDPATGTATFLVEVIDVVHRTMTEKWTKQGMNEAQRLEAWNDYVPKHLLPRLYGYELMMAPYAIAHMKIGLKLAETGYRFDTEERVRIYLTNSLEPWQRQLKLPDFDALAHEAAAVNEIKRHKRFTVVIGNPPYSLVSANMEPAHRTLVERYKFIGGEPLRERGALQLEKILNDDYVKFIAQSQNLLTTAGAGLVGLITNHAYLDNPTMRGLRHSFLASFKQGYFYDLGGSAKKVGEVADENVFDIQQGVAICIIIKSHSNAEVTNRHARLAGVRKAKYKLLGEGSVKNTAWSKLSPSPPYYLFVPTDYVLRSEYEQFSPLSEIFPLHSIGCFTSKDHFVISRDPPKLVANAKTFRDSKLPDKELCNNLEINPKDAWDVSRSREQIRQLSDGDIAKQILRFIHRPFDLKHIFFHRSLVWSLAYPVNRNLIKTGNLALVTSRQLATPPWNHVFCANAIVEMFLMSNRTKEGNHVFPLYVVPDEDAVQRSLGDAGTRPNFFAAFLKQLSAQLGLSQSEMGLPCGLTPEDIFHYTYAVFHCPGYRSRYAEFLKIDFPRLPLAGHLVLFRALARLGSELAALHLLKSPKLDQPITEFIGGGTPEVEKISWSNNTVWVDKAQTIGFKGVREDVWNFHIGCYQVCEKWLKDRKGQKLLKSDIAHYQKVVVALAETIRLMQEIDKVIEQHGGWPGAFSQKSQPSEKATRGPEQIATPVASVHLGGAMGLFDPDDDLDALAAAAGAPPHPKSKATSAKAAGGRNPVSAVEAADITDGQAMCAIRYALASTASGSLSRDTLIRLVARELGFARTSPTLNNVLDAAIRRAVRRGIAENKGGFLTLLVRDIDGYDRNHLKAQVLAAIRAERGTCLKTDAPKLLARFLGFARTGTGITGTVMSVLNSLVRAKVVDSKTGQIRLSKKLSK